MKQSITAPSYAVNNVSNLPDIVKNQATTVKTTFDKASVDIKAYETNLIAELNGNNGSKKIGHNSLNIASDNVGDAIEEVYAAIASTSIGELIDNSIPNIKLGTDIKVGSLATLTTTEKSNVVGAINEIDAYVDGVPEQADTIETNLNILRTAKVTTGSNVALAVDTDGMFDMTRNGNILTIIPNVTNTGAMTVTVDGQATLSVKKANDAGTLVDTEAGDSKQNVPMTLVLQTSGTPVFIYAPKGGSNIKSIQRGTNTSLSGVSSVNQSITSVDVNKSVVIIFSSESGGTQTNQILPMAKFLNGTTLEFSKGTTTGSTSIRWQVIEFNNVKSRQSGDLAIVSSSGSATISAVVLNKSIIFGTFKSNTTNTTVAFTQIGFELTNTTTVAISTGNAGNTGTAHYQVIEFN